MKIARVFAVVFACIGVVLLVGSMGFLLLNQDADVRIRELPQEAVNISEAFSQALNDGDLTAAAQFIYGQPDLGAEGAPEDPETAAGGMPLQKAFLLNIPENARPRIRGWSGGLP